MKVTSFHKFWFEVCPRDRFRVTCSFMTQGETHRHPGQSRRADHGRITKHAKILHGVEHIKIAKHRREGSVHHTERITRKEGSAWIDIARTQTCTRKPPPTHLRFAYRQRACQPHTARHRHRCSGATRKPPQHLVGKQIGPLRVALYGSKKSGPKTFDEKMAATTPWVAPTAATGPQRGQPSQAKRGQVRQTVRGG